MPSGLASQIPKQGNGTVPDLFVSKLPLSIVHLGSEAEHISTFINLMLTNH